MDTRQAALHAGEYAGSPGAAQSDLTWCRPGQFISVTQLRNKTQEISQFVSCVSAMSVLSKWWMCGCLGLNQAGGERQRDAAWQWRHQALRQWIANIWCPGRWLGTSCAWQLCWGYLCCKYNPVTSCLARRVCTSLPGPQCTLGAQTRGKKQSVWPESGPGRLVGSTLTQCSAGPGHSALHQPTWPGQRKLAWFRVKSGHIQC